MYSVNSPAKMSEYDNFESSWRDFENSVYFSRGNFSVRERTSLCLRAEWTVSLITFIISKYFSETLGHSVLCFTLHNKSHYDSVKLFLKTNELNLNFKFRRGSRCITL